MQPRTSQLGHDRFDDDRAAPYTAIENRNAPPVADGEPPTRPFGQPEWAGVEIEGEAIALPQPLASAASSADDAPPMLITDRLDDHIVAALDARQITVAAGDTAWLRLALLNNGDRPATFRVHVEGWVSEEWVSIARAGEVASADDDAHAQLWLQPGERVLLTIALSPPRLSAARAGDHPFAVVVRSPEYAPHNSRLGAVLTILGYSDVMLGHVQPRQVTVSWRRRQARLLLPVTNRGNVEANFFVQAAPYPRRQGDAYSISFQLPTNPDAADPPRTKARPRWRATAGRQPCATFTLKPGQTVVIGATVRPPAPPLLGLRSRQTHLRLAVGLVKAEQAPLTATVAIQRAPLISAWLLGAVFALAVLSVAGALLVTAVATALTNRPTVAPVAQPAPAPQLVTIVVQLAEPARTEPGAPAHTVERPAAPVVVDPAAPIVRPDQVTAPGAPSRHAGFEPAALQPASAERAQAASSPLTYQQMFQEIALRYDLNWRVLAGQAYIESGFDALALGASGDMGLMQILPNTWREWAPVVDAADPFDAYANTLVAAAYLDHLREVLGRRGQPEIEWMLVAYNWGIDKVAGHLDAGLTWDELPVGRRQYAIEILRIAETIPP
ncbi:MAG: transglycosylase SLT domain-containing protein [Caldilineaceae bacterium]|nr:transglycosylase SLT domain-containing protein [Caldilineaceae bacterium]